MLLDWLAHEFVQQGWSLKRLHRLILTSTAWRQSSFREPDKNALDPDNRFYWRKSVIRLEAESLRDRMLAATNSLENTLYGPPLGVKEDDSGQFIVDGEQTRRSLYIRSRRSQPVGMLKAFDAPVMETNCEVRPVSTVATQSLMLMNGEFILKKSRQLAVRAVREVESLEEEPPLRRQITRVWQLAFCRQPSIHELQLAVEFHSNQLATMEHADVELPEGVSKHDQALTNLCQGLLSSNEFMYVD